SSSSSLHAVRNNAEIDNVIAKAIFDRFIEYPFYVLFIPHIFHAQILRHKKSALHRTLFNLTVIFTI
ncbi:hypothetical protein, partial [Acinetobacter baumannii]|uniref:hypothetical protein n=1 Tax=Acinetobacter baumannii TaxID=470 RepID=UPI00003D8BA0